MSRRPRPPRRSARGLLPLLAFVLLLAVGCGSSSRRSCAEVVLRAVPGNGRPITAADLKTAQQTIEQRVETLGVTSPTVTVHGDEIVIRYSGRRPPANVASLAAAPGGRLQIFDLEPSLAPPSVTGNGRPAPLPSLYRLLTAAKSRTDEGPPQAYYLFNRGHEVVQGPAPSRAQLLSSYKGRQPAGTEVLTAPAHTEAVRCAGASNCPGAGSSGTSWYLFKLPAPLTSKDLVESGSTADIDPRTGQPIVTLQFTRHGSKEFQAITKAEYDRGRIDAGQAGRLTSTAQSTIARYAGHNAIVLDGRLEETPYIDYTNPSLADGIFGNAQLTERTKQAARRTALLLRSGALPYTFERVRLSGCAR